MGATSSCGLSHVLTALANDGRRVLGGGEASEALWGQRECWRGDGVMSVTSLLLLCLCGAVVRPSQGRGVPGGSSDVHDVQL